MVNIGSAGSFLQVLRLFGLLATGNDGMVNCEINIYEIRALNSTGVRGYIYCSSVTKIRLWSNPETFTGC